MSSAPCMAVIGVRTSCAKPAASSREPRGVRRRSSCRCEATSSRFLASRASARLPRLLRRAAQTRDQQAHDASDEVNAISSPYWLARVRRIVGHEIRMCGSRRPGAREGRDQAPGNAEPVRAVRIARSRGTHIRRARRRGACWLAREPPNREDHRENGGTLAPRRPPCIARRVGGRCWRQPVHLPSGALSVFNHRPTAAV